jgi:predicted Zn-dependent protease
MATTSAPDTDFQRLVVEQALALAREMETTAAAAAPQGKVLHQCEGLLLTRGREFLLQTLQAMAQHTADEAVKKKSSLAAATAATACGTKGRPPARS